MRISDKHESNTIVSLNIFATIGAVVVGFLSLYRKPVKDIDLLGEDIYLLYIVIVVIIIYIIINYRRINSFMTKITSRIHMFLNIVVEYRKGHLEFIDRYGKKAMYHEEILLNKISRRIIYEGGVEVEGRIDSKIQTYNCYNSINDKNNKVTFIYGNKRKNNSVITNKRQLQFGFALTFHNSFASEKESWESEIKHYTKIYDLEISFNKKNPPKNVDILQVFNIPQKDPILKSLSVDPLIIKKYDRIIMKVKLLHLKKGDSFRITWNWNKPKESKK